jgi:hypothetical protein
MKRLTQIIAAVIMALGSPAQTVHADLITTNIGFTGEVTLDTSSAATPCWSATDATHNFNHAELRKLGVMIENFIEFIFFAQDCGPNRPLAIF